ncbi:MAG: posphoenolpyruvate synthetase regulatory kinase/phosphorylase PpsR [Gammaproteobacteria bacterium]
MKRRVFFVSDRTGITVETLGQSLLTQFPGIEFTTRTIPFVTNPITAEAAAETIRAAKSQDGIPPLVFSTLTDQTTQNIITASNDHVFDLFGTFIGPLEDALGRESSHTAGRMHGMGDATAYERRLTALNFTLSHDDGLHTRDLADADIVLIGVSRCGKTPTCLYLAMHYSLQAANYPLTEDDFGQCRLPRVLTGCRTKLYGLTILPEQLSRIRHQRRPHGVYSTLAQCQSEVARAEQVFRAENIPFLDTTTVSIEEIAATIVRDQGLR